MQGMEEYKHDWPLFLVEHIFSHFNWNFQPKWFKFYNKLMWKSAHPGSGSNSQPSEHESPTLPQYQGPFLVGHLFWHFSWNFQPKEEGQKWREIERQKPVAAEDSREPFRPRAGRHQHVLRRQDGRKERRSDGNGRSEVDILLLSNLITCLQCDQIGRFFALWTTFSSLWQQLICPNLSHS